MNVSFSNGDGGMNIEKPIVPNNTISDRLQPGQTLIRITDLV